MAEFSLSAVQELPEAGGKGGPGRWGAGGTSPDQRWRPEHYETHKHTAVCGQPPTVLADLPQQATNPS